MTIKIDFSSKAATLSALVAFYNWINDDNVTKFRDKKVAKSKCEESIEGVDQLSEKIPEEFAEFVTATEETSKKKSGKKSPVGNRKSKVKTLTSRERWMVALVSANKDPMTLADIKKSVKKPGNCLNLVVESLIDLKIFESDGKTIYISENLADADAELVKTSKVFSKSNLDWSHEEDFPEHAQRKYCGMKIKVLKEHSRREGSFGFDLWNNGVIKEGQTYEDFMLLGGKNRTIKYEERQGTIEMVPATA